MYLDYDIDINKIRTSSDNGEPRLLLICVDANAMDDIEKKESRKIICSAIELYIK